MGRTIDQELQQGLAAHKEGRLQDAERLYRAILRSQPKHPDANYNLGVLAVSVSKVDLALPLFRTAIEVNPKIEQFWVSYIDALIKEKHFADAKQVLEQAKKESVDIEKLIALEPQLIPATQINEPGSDDQIKRVPISHKPTKLSEQKKKKKQNGNSIRPPQEQLTRLIEHYQNGRFNDAEKLSSEITEDFPKHQFAWKVLGAVLKKTGRVIDALTAMQKSVKLAPKDAEAHSNLGNTLRELARLDEAEASFNQAIMLKPDYAEAHSSLGNTLREIGRFDEAEASYNRAIALKPDYAEAHSNLGITLKALNRLDEAEASYRKAIALKPDYADAHSNLGNILHGLGRLDEAEASFGQAILLKSEFFEAHYNLGITLQELGRLDKALASYNQAIALKPDYASAHNNLGNTLREKGRLEEAEASYNKAIALKPDYAEAYNNLGNTLREIGRLDEAEANYNKAIALKPNYAEAHSNLGITLREKGRLEEAEASYNKAIALKPDYAEAHSNLGITLREIGRLDEAEASYNQAIALNPDFSKARSNLLFLNASMRFDASKYLEKAQGFSDMVAKKISAPFENWSCTKKSSKLRVGFVSADFKKHPVGYFIEGLLVQLQASSIELYAYPTNNPVGAITEKLKALFHSWKSLAGKSDKDAAQTIHYDGIHILIDLSGHTRSNRLSIFGWRPAPIQITWLGYFASTGLPEVDYILGDPFVTPQSEAHHFTEQIWQLPESYLCFTPPDMDLAVSSLPALSNDFVTFGCFNNLSRMTDEVVSVRADILHAVPNSKLFLKDKQLDNQAGRNRVLSRFAFLGIAEHRLILEGQASREDYLACYHRVDIALSPFPYGGGTTSVEGLWMGVPVITKKGDYFLSHLGESIAHNSNLSDWIAEKNEDYVAKAIEFASDLTALKMLRRSLRENLLKTPLYDLPRFASNFEDALWKMSDSINH